MYVTLDDLLFQIWSLPVPDPLMWYMFYVNIRFKFSCMFDAIVMISRCDDEVSCAMRAVSVNLLNCQCCMYTTTRVCVSVYGCRWISVLCHWLLFIDTQYFLLMIPYWTCYVLLCFHLDHHCAHLDYFYMYDLMF